MSEETSYEKLTRFADKTAAKYEERGYKVKVYKLPVSKQVRLTIKVDGE